MGDHHHPRQHPYSVYMESIANPLSSRYPPHVAITVSRNVARGFATTSPRPDVRASPRR
jgi:hypothetical protein